MNRALTLAVVLLGWTVAAAQGTPPTVPVGGTDLCLRCHGDFAETLARSVVHLPLEADGCTDCHSPHAARHGKLLRAEAERLCRDCHGDVVAADPAMVQHGALRDERSCLACHDPHASEHAGLLHKDEGATCVECHATLAAKLTLATPHMPAADGECSTCHVPHSATNTRLLADEIPALCEACHDVDDALQASHGGFTLSAADCVSCHEPHGSVAPALVRPLVHEPFADGDCSICHSNPAEPLSLELPETELCVLCHDQMDPATKKGGSHPVEDDVACSSCHSPHAGDDPAMMRGNQRALCLGCHSEVRRVIDHAKSTHPVSVEGGRCSVCHQPHDSAAPGLLRDEPGKLCLECHASHSRFAHPMGANVPDPSRPGRSLDCLSCHDPHASGYQNMMLASPDRALCVRCHQKLH